jgi:hypothetical protein
MLHTFWYCLCNHDNDVTLIFPHLCTVAGAFEVHSTCNLQLFQASIIDDYARLSNVS